jgi:hypothetical protein
MIRYEDDDTAIARALSALGDGEIIDHGTARTIASQYNCPGIAASFVTTGAMPGPAPTFLMEELTDQTSEQWRQDDALNALEDYLIERGADTGKVSGWSDMWVPKHVDYPHQDGALDTCWCYDEDDDSVGDAGTGHGAYEWRSGA